MSSFRNICRKHEVKHARTLKWVINVKAGVGRKEGRERGEGGRGERQREGQREGERQEMEEREGQEDEGKREERRRGT